MTTRKTAKPIVSMRHVIAPGPPRNLEHDLRGLEMVYYLHHKGHVKIGYTSTIVARLRSLRAKRTDLIGWEPADRDLERQRHEQFAHARVTGPGLGIEHYAMTPDLAAHVEQIRADMIARATRQTEDA